MRIVGWNARVLEPPFPREYVSLFGRSLRSRGAEITPEVSPFLGYPPNRRAWTKSFEGNSLWIFYEERYRGEKLIGKLGKFPPPFISRNDFYGRTFCVFNRWHFALETFYHERNLKEIFRIECDNKSWNKLGCCLIEIFRTRGTLFISSYEGSFPRELENLEKLEKSHRSASLGRFSSAMG